MQFHLKATHYRCHRSHVLTEVKAVDTPWPQAKGPALKHRTSNSGVIQAKTLKWL